MRRRRSSTLGKNEPLRSLGIFSSTSPALVVSRRGREPFRWLERVSVRSWGSAPRPRRPRRRSGPGRGSGPSGARGRRSHRSGVRRAPRIGQNLSGSPECSFRALQWTHQELLRWPALTDEPGTYTTSGDVNIPRPRMRRHVKARHAAARAISLPTTIGGSPTTGVPYTALDLARAQPLRRVGHLCIPEPGWETDKLFGSPRVRVGEFCLQAKLVVGSSMVRPPQHR